MYYRTLAYGLSDTFRGRFASRRRPTSPYVVVVSVQVMLSWTMAAQFYVIVTCVCVASVYTLVTALPVTNVTDAEEATKSDQETADRQNIMDVVLSTQGDGLFAAHTNVSSTAEETTDLPPVTEIVINMTSSANDVDEKGAVNEYVPSATDSASSTSPSSLSSSLSQSSSSSSSLPLQSEETTFDSQQENTHTENDKLTRIESSTNALVLSELAETKTAEKQLNAVTRPTPVTSTSDEPEVCVRYGRLLSTLDLCWATVTDFATTGMHIGTYLPIIRISQYENKTEMLEELEMFCRTYIHFMDCLDVELRMCNHGNTILDKMVKTGERACTGSKVNNDLRDVISAHFDASLPDRLACMQEVAEIRYGDCANTGADLLHGVGLNKMETDMALHLLHDSYQRSLSCVFNLLWDDEFTECKPEDVDILLQTALLSLPAGIQLTKEDLKLAN